MLAEPEAESSARGVTGRELGTACTHPYGHQHRAAMPLRAREGECGDSRPQVGTHGRWVRSRGLHSEGRHWPSAYIMGSCTQRRGVLGQNRVAHTCAAGVGVLLGGLRTPNAFWKFVVIPTGPTLPRCVFASNTGAQK
jgi:hypothetical protein